MAKSPKVFCKLAKIPSFKSDFTKLTSYEQWVVSKTIDSMLMMKNPARAYHYTSN